MPGAGLEPAQRITSEGFLVPCVYQFRHPGTLGTWAEIITQPKDTDNCIQFLLMQRNSLTFLYHLVIMPNIKMNDKERSRCETRAAILKALAHPMRLFMIEQLADKSYCVFELTEMVGLDVSTVSKHLSILRNAGLVSVQKRGKQVFYSLRIPCALNFLDCVEAVLREQAKDRMDAIQ